ncbi:hypothetical protein HYPSUDRAFT_219058 [Hypholoma sublateritium FD-334 SS-4]|uniref:FAD-binding PCMH-type domain-containing protein n=1 Tax=Hypholoma sublateritium (strain FD-334 SS-4) TaxID=945553 RepID=A0A0D2NKS9_HYPSF|nr:hypothetical protein HYPSUDRAFT_219058 [Hypholoma sublateritium FD-334 SS-4]
MKLLVWAGLLVYFCIQSSATAVSQSPTDVVCIAIAHAISSASEVFYPGDPLYNKGIYHVAISSTQHSKCVVEAGTPADVGKILVILGRTRTPFAVKGGGHITNIGFSSTLGVHISLYRFSEVKYNPVSQTVNVGSGLIWDDVYAALEPLGVNVVGARATGIGVAGFTLGGGYSYKTNQYGLAVDNVLAFQLVKPNGQVVQVSQASDPELFFGLKGGQNNFGVVTEFTLKTFPQTQVWGGVIEYPGTAVDAITAATVAFQNNVTDPKATIITAYTYIPTLETDLKLIIGLAIFYDAPVPPAGLFDAFLAVPATLKDVSTRNYLSLVQAAPTNFTQPTRVAYNLLPNLSFTSGVGALVLNETLAVGQLLTNKTLAVLSYAFEIFLPNIYSHNSYKTAFPPERAVPFQPFNILMEWTSSEFDTDYHETAVATQARLIKGQIALGQTGVANVPYYPNYAIAGTPLEKIYGANLPALMALKKRVDPSNVMGLAGGWKF